MITLRNVYNVQASSAARYSGQLTRPKQLSDILLTAITCAPKASVNTPVQRNTLHLAMIEVVHRL